MVDTNDTNGSNRSEIEMLNSATAFLYVKFKSSQVMRKVCSAYIHKSKVWVTKSLNGLVFWFVVVQLTIVSRFVAEFTRNARIFGLLIL